MTSAQRPAGCSRTLLRRHMLPLAAIFIASMASPVQAIGLGEASTSSRIGQMPRVEIPIQSEPAETVQASCFQLVNASAGNNEDLPWLYSGKISIEETGTGRRLIIVGTQTNDSPVMRVGVRIACGVELRRDYTLLLDPPDASAINAPVIPSVSVEPAPPVATPPAATPPARTWQSVEGDTPESIAAALLPHDRAAQRRFARALINRNSATLGQGNASTVIPAGTQLLLPPLYAATSKPKKSVAERTPPTTESSAVAPAQDQTTRPKTRARASKAVRDRLIVGADDNDGSGALRLATSIANRNDLSEKERDKLRLELQLIATLDDKIASQVELTDKLHQLETMQAQLQADSAELENQIRAQQARNQSTSRTVAAPPVRPMAVPPAPALPFSLDMRWLYWAAGVLVLLLAGWFWLRHRRQYNDTGPHTIATPHARGEAAGGTSDELFEPLSEDDIWPENAGRSAASGKQKTSAEGAIGPLSLAGLGPSSVLHINEDVEEHDSAVELAEIMMSFGRVHGAAQTLADFIRANPKQAVKPWIKLLEVYRTADMRKEFDALTAQLNKTFNVQPVTWDNFEVAFQAPDSLEGLAHIRGQLCELWGKRECQAYLHGLLRDNRQGTRQGFPLAVVDEILLLLAILETHLGSYRPDDVAIAAAAAQVLPPTVAVGSVSSSANSQATPTATSAPVPLLEPQDFTATQTAPTTTAAFTNLNSVDFEFDMDDLSRTLHINLDELGQDDDTVIDGSANAETGRKDQDAKD